MEQQIENLTYGTEIECLIPSSLGPHGLAAKLTAAGIHTEVQTYNHRPTTCWKIVTDGSVRADRPGFSPWEVVSPILTGDAGLEQIKAVSQVLITETCRINSSCGLHV